MNEIDKLKTEHARYKKALEDITRGVYQTEPSVIALKALHPVQRILPTKLHPVTLAELLTALEKLNEARLTNLHSIRFYSDGSGTLYSEYEDAFAGFCSLREALDMLNERGRNA